jgi:6-pyruvoyltetrahydropterin/6-carboxytetrahydropterin synthase
MYRISKEFTFEAEHHLVPPYEGKCARTHGHSYTVEVVMRAEDLNPCGMVMDFTDLSPLKHYIDQRLDHTSLNETIEQPTAENIARHIFDWLKGAEFWPERVRVQETAKCWAEYSE